MITGMTETVQTTADRRVSASEYRVLEQANAKRTARARLRAERPDVLALLLDPPECLVGMRIYELLLWQRGFGPVKADQVLARAHVGKNARIYPGVGNARTLVAEELRDYRRNRTTHTLPDTTPPPPHLLRERRRSVRSPTPEQRRRAQEVVRLYCDGLTFLEVARRIGVSAQRVQQVYARHATAEDRAAAAQRRLELRSERVEAQRRAKQARGDARRRRRDERRDQILRDVRAWHELFGEPPSATDWDGTPASRRRHAWRAERYDATGRRWPRTRDVAYYFGSWSAAVAAAGLTPRKKTDPKRHSHRRVKTHCKHGHELTGENLYVSPQGKRACRTCTRSATRRYQRSKRA